MVCGGQLRHFGGHHGGCACHMTHGVAYDGQSREVRVICVLEGCAGEKAQGGAIFNVKAHMKGDSYGVWGSVKAVVVATILIYLAI